MMASTAITGSVSALPQIPPMPAVARILARFERDQLAGFIAVALDLLDTIDGDPEAEDNADREATDGDGSDQAWVEWTSMRAAQKRALGVPSRSVRIKSGAVRGPISMQMAAMRADTDCSCLPRRPTSASSAA